MDMNKAFNLRVEDRGPKWRLIDATGQTLGRLATQAAIALRGKDKPEYTPHTDSGDYVVVINADKVELTGKKEEQKTYRRHSGWVGGMKETQLSAMRREKPEFIIQHAVNGMLPKTKLGQALRRKLKVYAGDQHPHKGQIEQ